MSRNYILLCSLQETEGRTLAGRRHPPPSLSPLAALGGRCRTRPAALVMGAAGIWSPGGLMEEGAGGGGIFSASSSAFAARQVRAAALISCRWTVVGGAAVGWCYDDAGGRGAEVPMLLSWRRSGQGGGSPVAAMGYGSE
jgi:hypothetical protein